MNADLLSAFTGSTGASLVEALRQMPYDDLVEIDLNANSVQVLYHVEGKFYLPMMEGSFDSLYHFCADHMVHPDDRELYLAFMDPATLPERLAKSAHPGLLESETRLRLMDGGWRWVRQIVISGEENGLPAGRLRLYQYDIQSVRDREANDALPGTRFYTPSFRDALTGLPTDRELFPRARALLETAQGQWCVIAIDIEHFKLFIDWHGKEAGDMLLAQIGKILARVQRETGGLAGYHGLDDFWLMMPYDPARIDALFQELRGLIVDRSNTVGFLPIFGVCMIEDRGEDVADIFNHAAMTAEQGKGDLHDRIRVYNASAYSQTLEEYRMLADFQRGIENHEVYFDLQPQCRVSNGVVVGAESLARWRRADGTMVSPARFVPVLEKYGMVTNLDTYIWEEVCRWLHGWISQGQTAVPISVNISQIDILTIDVPAFFQDLLRRYELPVDLVKIEITESAYVSDAATVRETVRRLREMGFLVLMDDFGSGYSSLNMLKSLNVDVIKLDAQFLRIQNQEERKGISILESIISMTKTMKLPIIVEGVETQEQINFLSDLGCRYMQGYFFHRPMSVEAFEDMIRDGKNIDLNGFEFKANNQLHAREFLDENVFSDAMLNNILGPVAIYRWKDDTIDIERYNQQFYLMVDIPLQDLNERIYSIEKTFYAEDVQPFFELLQRAYDDHLNGAKGLVRVYRPNNTLRWISVQLYFMSEDENGRQFFASCEDVTEMQFLNAEIPGGYFRSTMGEHVEFIYVSRNFQNMVGYTAEEIRTLFDNRLINMIHPEDVSIIQKRMPQLRSGSYVASPPYRLKCKNGSYIYVVVQTIATDLSGDVSLLSIATDVTEMMTLRNQMHLMSRYVSDSVVFLHKSPEGRWSHYPVINGLEEKLCLDISALRRSMDEGGFYSSFDLSSQSNLLRDTMDHMQRGEPFEFDCVYIRPDGGRVPLHMKMDHVDDVRSNVEYICIMRAI